MLASAARAIARSKPCATSGHLVAVDRTPAQDEKQKR
jgi:hypothetical protein